MASETPLLLGMDSSTTGCKAVVWDPQGQAIAEGRAGLHIQTPNPGWHQQDALDWWQAACTALRSACENIDPRRLAGLAISHQRESFVAVDGDANPLSPAMLWLDQRGAPLLEEIGQRLDREAFHRRSGKVLSANLAPAKIEWLRRERAELHPVYYLDTHAFLVQRLSGEYRTSIASADPLGLYDLEHGAWDEETLACVGANHSQMPEACPPGALLGKVTAEAAQQSGLPKGLPIFAGLGDGQAASLGSGLSGVGEASLSLGTSVIGGTCTDQYLTSRAFRTMTAGLPGAYILETVLLGGTYTQNWLVKDLLELTDLAAAVHSLEERASALPPGSQGLLLLPYWSGAMNPYWDADASGLILGLRGSHRREHIFRAILEGIAFELRLHLEGVEGALGQPIRRLIVSGGGARSPLWRSILAAISQKPLFHTGSPETASLGAAILAAAGAGLFPDVATAVQAMVHVSPEPEPADAPAAEKYDRLYRDVYTQLYPQLRSSMQLLERLK